MQFLLIGLLFVLTSFSNAAPQQGASVKILVIDPGHGGTDPGAIGPLGYHEANLALAVSLKFGALVEKYFKNIRVIYTRKTDEFVSLNDRAEIANKAKADLFFCIHLNSEVKHSAFGSSTYALGLHRTDENLEVAKRENAVIGLEQGGLKNYDFDPNSPEGHIIMSMKQNAFLDQSLKIAANIEDEQANTANRKSRGVKQAGFYVLYKTSMPSILTEIGFISNPTESQFLASENGQKLVAASLFKAFLKYKNEIEVKNDEVDLSDYIPASEKENIKEERKETATAKEEVKEKTADTIVKTAPKPKELEIALAPKSNTPLKTEVKATDTIVSPSSTKTVTTSRDSYNSGSAVNIGQFDIKPKTVKPGTVIEKKEEPKKTVIVEKPQAKIGEEKTKEKEKPKAVESKPRLTSKPAFLQQQEKALAIADQKPKPQTTTNEINPSKPLVAIGQEPVLIFRIQLFAAMNLPKTASQIEKQFGEIFTEKVMPKGILRVMVGNFENPSQVKKELTRVHSGGFPDAFIAAYENGKRVDGKRLNELIK